MKESCFQSVMTDQFSFAGGSDSQDILHALTKLAPDCSHCPGKQLHICIEASCVGCEPFCLSCESDLHFLHRKNELRMLFIDRKSISTFSQNKRQLLRELQEYIEERKKGIEGWVLQNLQQIMRDEQIIREKQERLTFSQASVDYGVRIIASCERLLMNIRLSECRMTTDWQDTMYRLVQRAVEGSRINLEDKLEFHTALLNMNLHEQKAEDSIQEFCLLEGPTCWEELPLVRVENVYWVNGKLMDMLKKFEKKSNLETLVRETNIERFIGRDDKQIYWQTTDSIYRSRILHSNYGSSKGSRLLLVGDMRFVQDVTLKNTLSQLYYDQSNINLTTLPSRLKALTISTPLQKLLRLPDSLECLRLMITNGDQNTSESICPLIEKMQSLRNLKYLAVNTRHLSNPNIKRLIQYSIKHNLRMLVLLTLEIGLCEYTVRKVESIFNHTYPQLKKHYILFRRKLQQIMLIHRSRFFRCQRIRNNILQYTFSFTEIQQDED